MSTYHEAIKQLDQDFADGLMSVEEYRQELILIDEGISEYLHSHSHNLNDLLDIDFD